MATPINPHEAEDAALLDLTIDHMVGRLDIGVAGAGESGRVDLVCDCLTAQPLRGNVSSWNRDQREITCIAVVVGVTSTVAAVSISNILRRQARRTYYMVTATPWAKRARTSSIVITSRPSSPVVPKALPTVEEYLEKF